MYAQIDNILDYYVRLPSDLRDPAGKGSGLRFSYVICPWKAASRAGWDMGEFHQQGCEVAPIVSILQEQTLPLEAGTAAPCTLAFLGLKLVWQYVIKVSCKPSSNFNTGDCVFSVKKCIVICSNVKF